MREIETGTGDLLAHVERGVGVVTLNRPERRNALTQEMLSALATVLPELAAAEDVRAVVLTGAGPAFCAGGDVKAFAARGGEGGGTTVPHEERIRRQQAMQRATVGCLYDFPKPTVAALTGAAAGAGLGFALACDLRIGHAKTVFATAFGKVGLSGDYGATWLLSRLVGPARARRAMFLGERIDAATAERWGMLDWVVEADEVAGFALTTAAELAAGSPESLAAIKQNLLDAQRFDLVDAMDREVPRHLACGLTDNHKEAVQAFVEKRPPVFS
ncbi:enoyl-CoA hydratase-related protein [Actinophytocola oryzae]|uniref:Enoyl-CoA hydratase n=1 Tax=Actinophytocola oryzae TaxID=502181 RepID=A0A4R7W567_9PSEU|nr:enoyl-CoA hydratase-related protein [Actinophytocola oryzae]TDV57702.1 enoyl-CoA hydratase [Actinophytocola oryzae]